MLACLPHPSPCPLTFISLFLLLSLSLTPPVSRNITSLLMMKIYTLWWSEWGLSPRGAWIWTLPQAGSTFRGGYRTFKRWSLAGGNTSLEAGFKGLQPHPTSCCSLGMIERSCACSYSCCCVVLCLSAIIHPSSRTTSQNEHFYTF